MVIRDENVALGFPTCRQMRLRRHYEIDGTQVCAAFSTQLRSQVEQHKAGFNIRLWNVGTAARLDRCGGLYHHGGSYRRNEMLVNQVILWHYLRATLASIPSPTHGRHPCTKRTQGLADPNYVLCRFDGRAERFHLYVSSSIIPGIISCLCKIFLRLRIPWTTSSAPDIRRMISCRILRNGGLLSGIYRTYKRTSLTDASEYVFRSLFPHWRRCFLSS